MGIVPDFNSGYVFAAFSLYWNQNESDALLVKVDEQGDTVFSVRKSKENTKYFPTALVKSHDDGYVIFSSAIDNLNNNRDFSLIKINSNNEIEFTKTYGDTVNSEQAMHIINTNDKGFLIMGQSVVPPNISADMYVVKTDSAGNFEWEQYYGGNNFEAACSAIQTSDTGYLILGWTQSFGNGGLDWYLVKTDGLGNQQWQRTYGGTSDESGNGIVALSDTVYLLSGGGGNGFARLRKITKTGMEIWQKGYSYSGSEANYLYWARELPDKSIVAAGGTNNLAESDAGWLIKTDSVGTLLWQRKYNKTANVELFYDFIPTADGGFLMCGQAWNINNSSQDAWLLKVDSVGCEYENCLVGIDEINKKVIVDVYPNPASEILNIELQETGKIYEVELTNINGQVIYQSEIRNPKSVIDISQLTNGIYLLMLQNSEQRTTFKIVIQH